MDRLNKKLAAITDRILTQIGEQSIIIQSLIVAQLPVLQQVGLLNEYTASFVAVVIFTITTIVEKAQKFVLIILTILGLSAFTYMQILGVAAVLTASLGLHYFMKGYFSELTSMLFLANLSHLGDAITTYIALQDGLMEQNPFIFPIIKSMGSESIFTVKTVIPVITLYVYKIRSRDAYTVMKAIFFIGLYLTIANLITLV